MMTDTLTDDELAAWLPPHLRPTDGLLTSPQVCRAAGVTYRQLDYWIRQEWIIPTIDARGSGRTRRFHRDQVADVKLLARFARFARLELHLAADAVALWANEGRPDDMLLGVADEAPRLWTVEELLADIRGGAACIVVNPEEIR